MKPATPAKATQPAATARPFWHLPPQTRRKLVRWGSVVAILCTLLMLYVDRPLMLHYYKEDYFFREFLKRITFLGDSGLYLIPTALLALLLHAATKAQRFAAQKQILGAIYQRTFFLFCSIAASGLVNSVIKIVMGRPRPSIFRDGETAYFLFFQLSSKMWSFPSGHSNTVFALATALTLLFPKVRFVVFPVAVLIAVSRLFTGSHYLSDIIAGAFIGIAVTIFVKQYFVSKDIAVFNG